MAIRRLQIFLILIVGSALLLACQIDQLLSQTQDTASEAPTDTPLPSPIPPSKTPLLPPTPIPTATHTPIPIRVYATAKVDLQVRAGPSTNTQVIDRLAKGNSLQVVGRTQASDWWQVMLTSKPNQTGWISAQYTTLNNPADSIPVVNAQGTPQAPTATASPKVIPSPTIQYRPVITATPNRTQAPGGTQPTATPPFNKYRLHPSG